MLHWKAWPDSAQKIMWHPNRRYHPKIDSEDENEDDMYGHLTNYWLNKDSDKYVNNDDFKNNDNGSKRLLTTIFSLLKEEGADVDKIKAEIKDIWTKIVIAMQPFLINSYHSEMGINSDVNQNCFHIFGLDILLDDDYNCWVMEINAFPSFSYFYEKVFYDPEEGVQK